MHQQTLAFLGRQPAISLAELESVLGQPAITKYSAQVALVNVPASEVPAKRLGGTQKLASVVAETQLQHWPALSKQLLEFVRAFTADTEGKLTLGLSCYGLRVQPKDLQRCLLDIKQRLKSDGRSVRIISNNQPQLSTAQVLHNRLWQDSRLEINLISHGASTLLALTTWVQDIEAYTRRDQQRPARDARVGMLPPKLAQILVNLAAPGISQVNRRGYLLDAFCGTGVIAQEAALMGFSQIVSSDIEPRMVDYTQQNFAWLQHNLPKHTTLAPGQTHRALKRDATKDNWPERIAAVASETYLGPPLVHLATPSELAEIVPAVDDLHQHLLGNLARQTVAGTRLALAVPAWAGAKGGFKHLPVLDSLASLGYNRIDFANAGTQELIYHRPGQAVARELVVLVRQ